MSNAQLDYTALWTAGAVLSALLFLSMISYLIERFVISSPPYQGAVSDHFDGKKFFTPGAPPDASLGELLRWVTNRDEGEWLPARGADSVRQTVPERRVADGATRIVFINHATTLIQTEGVNILTDPVWADVVGVFDRIGARRVRPPGVAFDDLPPIDVVLVSHNHYDHCDIGSLQKLDAAFSPTFIVPLGVKALLVKHGVGAQANAQMGAQAGGRIVELDWEQETSVSGAPLRVHCVPARHFSGRGVSDRNASLWCGFVIENLQSGEAVYFAGDSGYGDHFKRIGERFPAIACALLPIGAFRPEWFMARVHISPKEAVQAHQDLRARFSLGIHFGAFPLADDGENEPIEELRRALDNAGLPRESFRAIDFGEYVEWR
jgi:L-ascorbate metabolism protein UlaG (beta-lactamase superfamily)